MTARTTRKLWTADDLMRLPDDGWQYELDEGRLVRTPLSSWKSSRVALRLARHLMIFIDDHDLGAYAGEGGGWLLATGPDTVRAPDFAFVHRDRLAAYQAGYFPGVPDLAVEVLSPSDRRGTVARKVRQYLALGVRLVWVVDPERRTVAIHRPHREVTMLGEDGILDGEDVLPGFSLPLSEIWVYSAPLLTPGPASHVQAHTDRPRRGG